MQTSFDQGFIKTWDVSSLSMSYLEVRLCITFSENVLIANTHLFTRFITPAVCFSVCILSTFIHSTKPTVLAEECKHRAKYAQKWPSSQYSLRFIQCLEVLWSITANLIQSRALGSKHSSRLKKKYHKWPQTVLSWFMLVLDTSRVATFISRFSIVTHKNLLNIDCTVTGLEMWKLAQEQFNLVIKRRRRIRTRLLRAWKCLVSWRDERRQSSEWKLNSCLIEGHLRRERFKEGGKQKLIFHSRVFFNASGSKGQCELWLASQVGVFKINYAPNCAEHHANYRNHYPTMLLVIIFAQSLLCVRERDRLAYFVGFKESVAITESLWHDFLAFKQLKKCKGNRWKEAILLDLILYSVSIKLPKISELSKLL